MNKINSLSLPITIIALKIALILTILIIYLPQATEKDLLFDNTFLWFLLAGFFAQLVDGALGMAYGVTSNSILLGFGLSPKLASAAVHTAEVFTTGVSGLSHIKYGNFDRKLFLKIVIPGVLAASVGAFLLGSVVNGDVIKPYVSGYLVFLGIIILFKAFKDKIKSKENLKYASYYATVGGFLDAIGGGGWGPIVTSNLIRAGNTPNIVIGTVNTAEFFVTFFSAGILLFFTGIQSWQIILGLIIGGTIAAPIGALATKRIPHKPMMIVVGALIILVSSVTLIKSFGLF